MTIIEVLKDKTTDARLTFGGLKWMFWDGEEWVVKIIHYGNINVLYRGDSEQDAVEALMNGG